MGRTLTKLIVCLVALGGNARILPAAEETASTRKDAVGDPLPPGAVSRLGSLRWVHGNEVDLAFYLPDGRGVLTVDQDGIFRVWEKSTGKLVRRFGSRDCKQVYWHVYHRNEKKRRVNVVGNPHPTHIVAISPDGGAVAISHGDGHISLWDIATGTKIRTFEANVATTLAFAPDGRSLFTRDVDQLVRQYDLQEGKWIRTFGVAGPESKLFYGNDSGGLSLSPDNKTVFSIHMAYQDNEPRTLVRSWNVATGKELPPLMSDHVIKGLAAVAFSPQGRLLAVTDWVAVIHVWDLVAAKEIHRFETAGLENSGYYATLAFSPDGKRLVSRSENRTMTVWDPVNGKELAQVRLPKNRPEDFYTGNIDFSPDGLRLLSPGRAGTVRQVEIKSGNEIDPPGQRHRDLVESLTFSPDGKTVTTLSHDHILHQWKTETGVETRQVQLPEPFQRGAFSGDGKKLAVAGYRRRLYLAMWDAVGLTEDTDQEVNNNRDVEQTIGPRRVGALAVSATGHRLVALDFTRLIRLWRVIHIGAYPLSPFRFANETEDNEEFERRENLALSPDGTLLAELTVNNEDRWAIRVWEVETGRLIRIIDLVQKMARAFVFSPDGRTIAATNADRSITLWEVATGKPRATLGRAAIDSKTAQSPETVSVSMTGAQLRPGELTCLAFSHDGKLLAAGDSSGRVRRFDVATGGERQPFSGHLGPVLCLAFAGNSQRLVSGSADTTALVWDIPPATVEVSPARVLEQKELEQQWERLRSDDAAQASQAIRTLRQFPKQVVPFLQSRLRPFEVDHLRLARLIADLDSNLFPTREKASKELQQLGEVAKPAIQKALDAKPTPEAQTRLQALLARSSMHAPTDQLRALELLESIGSEEARQLVRSLAKGADVARITRDARETLERMGGGLK